MKKKACLFAVLLALSAALPPAAGGAEDRVDAIEKELGATLKEMDELAAELGRIEEITAVPKATSIRVEVQGRGKVAAPAAARLLLSGKVEAEREWTREDRERFLSGGGPVVLATPLLPGTHEGRLVLSHPSWKASPSYDFRASLRAGDTYLLKLVLTVVPGKNEPSLVAAPER